ncbi:hypothetical protein E2C01_082841 [Portunus trituberculatus]|uniref:Uncharacterized protein n=1 Tax=Portunus trituberculatus TaxID=210409 RepID=A0A5B7J2Y2_PORTR|nr:hypothetical protein [Portunus trituberculatus]
MWRETVPLSTPGELPEAASLTDSSLQGMMVAASLLSTCTARLSSTYTPSNLSIHQHHEQTCPAPSILYEAAREYFRESILE